MKIYKRGNSEGIQREFRGNSDAKKGIRIKCNENMVRFAMIFDTEITPSYPFIIYACALEFYACALSGLQEERR